MSNPKSSSGRSRAPEWYYRVLCISSHGGFDGYRDVKPGDFDEDISDLEEPDKEDESEGYCDCDSDASECDCELSIDDHVSERSYTEDDADYYYEVKEMREERKRVLRDMREEEASIRQEEYTHNEEKMNEVCEVYQKMKEAIQNGEKPPILNALDRSSFRLFSVDHVDYRYDNDLYPTRYVEFYDLSESSNVDGSKDSTDSDPKPLYGHVSLDANTTCGFDAFFPPTKARLEKNELTAEKGKLKFELRFLSNDYLIIYMPTKVVFGSEPIPPSAPKKFKFAGIRCTLEMSTQERETRLKRKRSASSGA